MRCEKLYEFLVAKASPDELLSRDPPVRVEVHPLRSKNHFQLSNMFVYIIDFNHSRKFLPLSDGFRCKV